MKTITYPVNPNFDRNYPVTLAYYGNRCGVAINECHPFRTPEYAWFTAGQLCLDPAIIHVEIFDRRTGEQTILKGWELGE